MDFLVSPGMREDGVRRDVTVVEHICREAQLLVAREIQEPHLDVGHL
jgi:hypothetical protein